MKICFYIEIRSLDKNTLLVQKNYNTFVTVKKLHTFVRNGSFIFNNSLHSMTLNYLEV